MDDFIDDEINSSEENEPVLLDLKDLLKLKKETTNNEKEKENIINSSFFKYVENDIAEDNECLIDKKGTRKDGESKNLRNLGNLENLRNWKNWENWNDFKEEEKKNYARFQFISKYKNSVVSFFSKYKSRNTFHKSFDKVKNMFLKKKKDENYYGSSSVSGSDLGSTTASATIATSGLYVGEWFHIILNRLYYSKLTSFIYAFVFLLNIFILVYGLFTNILSKFLVMAEIFVIWVLIFEVSLRILTEGRNYFNRIDGIFDITITLMSSLFLISSGDLRVFISNNTVKTKSTEIEEIISQSLTAMRFFMQLFRMITFVMHHKRTKAPTANIDFSLLNGSFDDF